MNVIVFFVEFGRMGNISYNIPHENGKPHTENDEKYYNLLKNFKNGGGDPDTYVRVKVGNSTWDMSYTQSGGITGAGLTELRNYLNVGTAIDEIRVSRKKIDIMEIVKHEGAVFYPSENGEKREWTYRSEKAIIWGII